MCVFPNAVAATLSVKGICGKATNAPNIYKLSLWPSTNSPLLTLGVEVMGLRLGVEVMGLCTLVGFGSCRLAFCMCALHPWYTDLLTFGFVLLLVAASRVSGGRRSD